MAESTDTAPHRTFLIVGAILFSVGLLTLAFPVFLGAYDSYGIQINCGNGYYSQLMQAATDDQQSAGASGTAGMTHYVDQCRHALALRRAWTIPTAVLGALMLLVRLAKGASRWARNAGSPDSAGWSATADPDEQMHEAARLDRRERPHRDRPPGTVW